MRAVVQRVARGSVTVEGKPVSATGPGLVVLLGVGRGDTRDDAVYMAGKIAGLRIFEDEQGKMNLSVLDTGGSLLLVSQFTLYGDCRKGRRPGFSEAALPEKAKDLFDIFVEEIEKLGPNVATGCFGEHMTVEIINNGPVTLLLDSKKNF